MRRSAPSRGNASRASASLLAIAYLSPYPRDATRIGRAESDQLRRPVAPRCRLLGMLSIKPIRPGVTIVSEEPAWYSSVTSSVTKTRKMKAHMSGPLPALSDWDDFVGERYQPGKEKDAYRVYDDAPPVVREFYRLNHTHQTLDFVLAKKRRISAARTRGGWASGKRWSTSTRWWTTATPTPISARSNT